MSTVERLLQEARELPPAEQIRLSELLAQEVRKAEMETRREAIRQAKGSMVGLLPSTEEFLAEKHAEIEKELKREEQ